MSVAGPVEVVEIPEVPHADVSSPLGISMLRGVRI